MARVLPALAASALALLAAAPGASAQLRGADAQQRFVPGEALVRFEPGVAASERRDARSDAGVSLEETLELPRAQVVSFDGSVRSAIGRLEGQPGVAYAQPNYRYHALAEYMDELWGLASTPGVGAQAAWSRTRGAGQTIAVLDTGVDLTHPDLTGNLWTGTGGIHGFDFVHDDADPSDHQYHGTHVAATAAAVAGNDQGVAGVAPEADIMAVRVLDGDGAGSTSSIADGILFASQNGAGVINLSLGGPAGDGDNVMSQAAGVAEQLGSVIVAAAGNGGDDGVGDNNDAEPQTPCTLSNSNVICVAAIDNQSELATYSNFGPTSVDVGAPGGDVQAGELEILSAKPSWAAPVFRESFESIGDWTLTTASGLPWGTQGMIGSRFAADSPAANYQNGTDSRMSTAAPVSLAGRQGCRMHLDVGLDTQLPDPTSGEMRDFLTVGANGVGQDFSGSTGGFFEPVELTVSELDGQAITPALEFKSDATVVDDGVFVDDLRVLCRGAEYDNDIVDADDFELPAARGGSYMAISGTSMATPHVAGVAALVRAADPGVPASQVAQAIRDGARPLPSLAGRTVSGGTADAVGAIDAALAMPNSTPPPPPTPTPTPTPNPPGKARIGRVSVNNRGVVTLRLRGDADTTGVTTLSAHVTRMSAARLIRVARKKFRIGVTGRAAVRLKLRPRALRQLRRKRRLALRARVVLTNAAGLTSTARARSSVRLRRLTQP